MTALAQQPRRELDTSGLVAFGKNGPGLEPSWSASGCRLLKRAMLSRPWSELTAVRWGSRSTGIASARYIFDRHGLRGCGGPSGPHESIRFFARAHGVDEPMLLRELEQAMATPPSLSNGAVTAYETPEIADTIYRRYFLPSDRAERYARSLGAGLVGVGAGSRDAPRWPCGTCCGPACRIRTRADRGQPPGR